LCKRCRWSRELFACSRLPVSLVGCSLQSPLVVVCARISGWCDVLQALALADQESYVAPELAASSALTANSLQAGILQVLC
jgi:hypothetical protein